jgi:cell wall-associated NlpC family hydrolase
MANRRDIFETARGFHGTRFRHQGRLPGIGLDCVGVVSKTAHALGISQYDFTNYPRNPDFYTFQSHFDNNMRKKKLADILPGDVVIFKQRMFTCHCGIIGDRRGLSLIHAYLPRKAVTEEDFLNSEWDKPDRFVAAYEYIGLESYAWPV